ncbi:GNAT family N-acetyltransferase [Streptomyces peucetius]|uniref:GNAT family N-acetyltransferase n=1 Tax=Streptomyces peucetius TaxID=1950 RepID=A0ABY6IER3_STRPE|nr:GNAT family protein [Streptomyces peucetius]UYQ65503.1 GNAT family N-acetyltransferase [Streptomyces peucetius]
MSETAPADGAGRSYPVAGERVGLRRCTYEDAAEFTAYARRSTAHHRPWLFPPLTEDDYAAYAERLIEDPARAGFLVCERPTGRIAGYINVNNIVHGAFLSGAVGYGAFAHALGRGLMGEGLRLLVAHAFSGGGLGLHRLEANIQPGNTASLGLVRSVGFRLEGYSPDFLYIDGAWRDHERWAITREMTDRARRRRPV